MRGRAHPRPLPRRHPLRLGPQHPRPARPQAPHQHLQALQGGHAQGGLSGWLWGVP
uniref:Uncharacterized protein n=1 Tax=Arcella intermedia TaxID=1963864 RepID=A0A6B2LUG6_9EUKA